MSMSFSCCFDGAVSTRADRLKFNSHKLLLNVCITHSNFSFLSVLSLRRKFNVLVVAAKK